MSENIDSTTYTNEVLKEKAALMKEDYDNEWWRPSSVDDYKIKNKLFRVGCRPLSRKFNKCILEKDAYGAGYCQVS